MWSQSSSAAVRDAAVLDPVERGGEVVAGVVLGVVGEHGVDGGDGVAGEELAGSVPEGGAGRAFLVVVDLGVCETAVGVDRGVHFRDAAASLFSA